MVATSSISIFRFLVVLAAHLLVACQAQQQINEIEIDSSSEDYMGWKDYMFLMFRFGLFALIICFPFIRGLLVWYRAGGRAGFRRSEGGWIVGLRFRAPDMDRWLILSGYAERAGMSAADFVGSERSPRKLTADEVYALPEIFAPRVSSKTMDGDVDIEIGRSPGDDDELAVTYHGDDGETEKADSADTNFKNIDANDSDAPRSDESASATTTATATATATTSEEVVTESSCESPSRPCARGIAKPLFTTTMSTSCSICIEDFQEGEKVRLLPRCGHAFHTECILPWLTERQGCCPCCKELVICPEATTEESKENEATENQNQTNEYQNESRTNGDESATALDRGSYMNRNNSVLGLRGYHASPFVGPW